MSIDIVWILDTLALNGYSILKNPKFKYYYLQLIKIYFRNEDELFSKWAPKICRDLIPKEDRELLLPRELSDLVYSYFLSLKNREKNMYKLYFWVKKNQPKEFPRIFPPGIQKLGNYLFQGKEME